MHLGVDNAGQNMQAAGVEALGNGPAQVAQRRDPAVPDPDIGLDSPHRRHDRAAGNRQVE